MTTETKTKKEEAQERRQELNDIIAVMDTAPGRRFIWRILESANIFRAIYGPDAEIFRMLGERNLGLKLMNEVIEAKPELYLLMQKEHYIVDKPDKPAKEQSDA